LFNNFNNQEKSEESIALCLSGGGYRAMLFHTGTLLRLNELGILHKLKAISSVSSGSIIAGVLAANWKNLDFQSDVAQNFYQEIVEPIRKLASLTIDVPSVIAGAILGKNASNKIVNAYREHLFGNKTLQDITNDPIFIFNSTNIQSGSLWSFTKQYMGDLRVGKVNNPEIELAVVVAASSAFPIVFPPVKLSLSPKLFTASSGIDLYDDRYRTNIVLTDGGIYDNLGLENVWGKYQTILVSDAITSFNNEPVFRKNWFRNTIKIFSVINNQVRDLRKLRLIEAYKTKNLKGAYWSICENIHQDYILKDNLDCSFEQTKLLSKLSTRLKRIDQTTQKKLINWGYAVCDASIRQHLYNSLSSPKRFPYSEVKLGL
jgi:NTE family protein